MAGHIPRLVGLHQPFPLVATRTDSSCASRKGPCAVPLIAGNVEENSLYTTFRSPPGLPDLPDLAGLRYELMYFSQYFSLSSDEHEMACCRQINHTRVRHASFQVLHTPIQKGLQHRAGLQERVAFFVVAWLRLVGPQFVEGGSRKFEQRQNRHANIRVVSLLLPSANGVVDASGRLEPAHAPIGIREPRVTQLG